MRRVRGVPCILLMLLVMAACGGSDFVGPDPDSGIPLALAEERSARLSNVRYDLRFTIPESAAEPITGTAAIRFDLKDAERPVVLDFAPGADHLTSVTVGGRAAAYRAVNGHIVIAPRALAAGENAVEIDFRAGDIALNRNPDFLYSLFVPARAHLTFPCFDQPDIKARFTLALTGPAGWEAISNGAETARETAGGQLTVRFAETQPIPTYLFAFAAGRFQVETGTRNGRTFRIFHRETDQAKVARNRDAAFDLHASALQWLEDYTAHPVSVRQVRFPPRAVVSVQRHGTPGGRLLQRRVDLSRRVGDREPGARPRQRHRARNGAHVVRRSGDDAVVQRRVDEGSLRQLHGGEDRQSLVPEGQPRAPVPGGALPGSLCGRSHRGHPSDPAGARQPERGGQSVRRDHLPEGADRHASARVPDRGRRHAGGAPRLPETVRVRQRHLARSRAAAGRAERSRRRGLEPRMGRRIGPSDDWHLAADQRR